MNNSSQKMLPLVSVIIPTFNHGHFLTQALSSVINQTFSNWEAIVINNYSTDNTLEVVESFNDSRIKLINFHNNGIIAAARNEGIKNARGMYIAFLDSDDSWLPKKLETCLDYFNRENCDLICNSELLVENGKSLAIWHHGPDSRSSYKKLLFQGNCISTSAVTIKKQCLTDVGYFNEDKLFMTAEDYDLWLKLAKAGYHFKFIEEVLGKHLKHSGSSSSSVTKHLEAVQSVVESHFKNFSSGLTLFLNQKTCYSILFYGAARQAASQKLFNLAWSYYIKSWRQNPFRIKTYAGVLLLCLRYIKKEF